MPDVGVDASSPLPSEKRPRSTPLHALPHGRDHVANQATMPVVQVPPSERALSVSNPPGLPLTPPTPDEEKRSADGLELQEVSSSLSGHTTLRAVTPNPQNPLTPDITPPSVTPSRRAASIRMEPPSSSRAESFQTAFENISSDGEVEGPWHSTHSFTRQSLLLQRSQRSFRGDESPSKRDGANTKGATPVANGGSSVNLTASLSTISLGRMQHIEEDSTGISVEKRRSPDRLNRSQGRSMNSLLPSPTIGDGDVHSPQTPPKARSPGHGSMKHIDGECDSPSIEGSREKIEVQNVPSRVPENPSPRRLSTLSTTSTVEVVVIDSSQHTPPRSLRHTEKRLSLRSASSPTPRSQGTTPPWRAESIQSQHRLVRKSARITDRGSLASDTSVSPSSTSTVPQQKVDVIPVVVIPQRRSSLNFSTAPSQAQTGMVSGPSNRQADTRIRSGTVSDRQRGRKRAKSDAVAMSSQRSDVRVLSSGPPSIPARSSSLSAPTSRNNSRATSLTSESLRQHTLAMDLEHSKSQSKQPAVETSDKTPGPNSHATLEPHGIHHYFRPSLVGLDDMSHLRPPSLPFTQGSLQSSSPGPVEISEATAVNLFPHKNTSLLVVDQEVYQSHAARALQIENKYNYENARTPEISSRDNQVNVDSPLTNPRPPPKPPVPNGPISSPTNNVDDQHEVPNDGGLDRCRFRSVRRAWNARSRPESFSSFSRSFSLRSVKNRKAGKEIDSKSHPFWRPRGFWDDLATNSDPSSPECDDAGITHNPDIFISNSLGMPQERLIFDGPSSLARRSPELKRIVDGMSRQSPRTNVITRRMLKQEMRRLQSVLDPHRLKPAFRRAPRVYMAPARNLKKRVRRMQQKRTEMKQERRRERVKKSIVLLNGDGVHADGTTNSFV
ncbi:hypothetical protein MPDQ_004362 [Monascus purpureus]|uniref:Uncharacterized protein n=1 Tax=Monascus purpureus TaxID=5098 RepID=A0A507R1E3_MONPU|nr:hypothetical protein MPDQ_004362 [Monascus purpureus]BDD64236.1 hypothetical protein MAP00_009074 [Monascus purpureus]